MQTSLRQYRDLLSKYVAPFGSKFGLLALLLLSNIGLQLLNPQLVRAFIDAGLAARPPAELVQLGIAFLGIGLLQQLCTLAVAYLGEDVGWQATNRLRADLTRHCLQLDLQFHHARTPGELIERIDGDATALSNFFSQFLIRVLGSVLLLLGVLVLLFREDWRAGLVLSAFVGVALLLLVRLREFAVPATREERQASAMLFGFMEERLAGLEDVRANGAGPYVMQRFYQVARQLFERGRYAWMRRSFLWVLMLSTIMFSYVVSLGVGIWLFSVGAITLGTVYLFVQYTELLQGPLEQLTQELQDLQKAGASLGRIVELAATEPRLVDSGTAELPRHQALTVDCEAMHFGYDKGAALFTDFNLHIPAGQVVGLLGRTGSGKSSLTRLLMRLYDPQAGSVRLGGQDLRAVSLASLRASVAMVTQEVHLFDGSLRENLTLFDPSVPDERLEAALAAVELGDWWRSLPEGLATRIAAGGLSAGEAQLIAFARVLLKDPGLVILDEPSSRLDPATEARIERAISRLLAGRTGIVIAHRLATVRRADAILILDGGRVVEYGSREALAADPHSRFAGLLERDLQGVLV